MFTIKQQLINACQRLNLHIQYDDQLLANDENQYESILSVRKDDRLLAQFRGHGLSQVRAHENVSMSAWRHLRQLFHGTIEMPRAAFRRHFLYMQPPVPVQQH